MITFEKTVRRLTRAEASIYLRDTHGVSRTPATLAKLATVGGGPRFRKIGSRSVAYDIDDLDHWAKNLIGIPVSSTSHLERLTLPSKGMEEAAVPEEIENGERVTLAAEWLAAETSPPRPIYPELKRRFGLSAAEACEVAMLAGRIRSERYREVGLLKPTL